MIWISSCWIIWMGRNHTLFQGRFFNLDEVVLPIKFISWNWLIVASFFCLKLIIDTIDLVCIFFIQRVCNWS